MSVQLNVPAMRPEKPNRKGSRKLIVLLVVFFLTVLIILFFQSSISKVTEIEITGNEMVDSGEIEQASNIRMGDSFFLVDAHESASRIKELSMIESVQITKSFPGHVTIAVQEFPRVAFQINANGEREVLLADGSAYPVSDAEIPLDKPILTGWTDDNPLKVKLTAVLAEIPNPMLSDVSEIVPEPSAAYEDKIRIYTNSKYEVSTRIEFLAEKLQYLEVMIAEWKEQGIQSGELILMEQDRGIPFENDRNQDQSKDSGGQGAAKKR